MYRNVLKLPVYRSLDSLQVEHVDSFELLIDKEQHKQQSLEAETARVCALPRIYLVVLVLPYLLVSPDDRLLQLFNRLVFLLLSVPEFFLNP